MTFRYLLCQIIKPVASVCFGALYHYKVDVNNQVEPVEGAVTLQKAPVKADLGYLSWRKSSSGHRNII